MKEEEGKGKRGGKKEVGAISALPLGASEWKVSLEPHFPRLGQIPQIIKSYHNSEYS